MIETNASPVFCFGELLWDSLPQGLFPGGAPVNVAYHLKQLGRRAIPVTAVGADFLGEELLRRLTLWGLETDSVSILPEKRTGAVQAQIDSHGSAKYTILQDVAWDWIQVSPATVKLAGESVALVYGTLAQRSENNRSQLAALMEQTAQALKVYDVNLRPPYDSPELVWQLAQNADVIKLNDEELVQLLGNQIKNLECGARSLAEKSDCSTVCVTAGARGAGLFLDEKWFWAEGRSIKVKDTIGAGDSFLAALIHGLLDAEQTPNEILQRACRLAEFVASSAGATPAYSISKDQIQSA